MNGSQIKEHATSHHAKLQAGVRYTILASVLCTVPFQASAIGYLKCVLPANNVAISDDLEVQSTIDCFSNHLKQEFEATASYYFMNESDAISNLESAKANIALMPPSKYNIAGYDLAVVVTAFGAPEEMALDVGSDFKELAMVTAQNTGDKTSVSHEMGDTYAVAVLKELRFAALQMENEQEFQHFHVIGVNCK